jgi:ribosomal protein S4
LLALKSVHKSNQIKNKINSTKFFNTYLEKRLDVVLLRSHFVLSIKNARQLINHGHVFVNNLMVKDPGFCIKKGDIINISKKTHKILRYYLGHSPVWPLPPLYLQISYALFQILVVEDIFVSNNSIKFFTWLNLNNVIHLYKK